MAAIILRADLEQKKKELISKYNILIMNIERLEKDKISMNNEALMTKGAIQMIEEQLNKLDKEDEEIAKAGKMEEPEEKDEESNKNK